MASRASTRLSQPHAGLIAVDKLDAIGNAVHVMRVLSAGRFSHRQNGGDRASGVVFLLQPRGVRACAWCGDRRSRAKVFSG
jgi:hypothetical protein